MTNESQPWKCPKLTLEADRKIVSQDMPIQVIEQINDHLLPTDTRLESIHREVYRKMMIEPLAQDEKTTIRTLDSRNEPASINPGMEEHPASGVFVIEQSSKSLFWPSTRRLGIRKYTYKLGSPGDYIVCVTWTIHAKGKKYVLEAEPIKITVREQKSGSSSGDGSSSGRS